MSAATNRRNHQRVKPKQLATRVWAGEDLHIGLGIENISMGGVFVRCKTPLKVGRSVVLEVTRAGAALPIEIEGKVTSSISLAAAAADNRSPGMGISFDPLPPHTEQRLEGLIGAIDPSVLKPPPAKRAAKAPLLVERTELTPSHRPVAPNFDVSKTFVPLPRQEVVTDVPRTHESLRREVIEKNERIAQLEAENKKLRQRLLNLVNHGS